MKSDEYELKYQTCNLCDALQRNINDNFLNVSFEIYDDGQIQIRVVLTKRTEVEDDYIDDMVGEFEALQELNLVKKVEVLLGENIPPLGNIVYHRS